MTAESAAPAPMKALSMLMKADRMFLWLCVEELQQVAVGWSSWQIQGQEEEPCKHASKEVISIQPDKMTLINLCS